MLSTEKKKQPAFIKNKKKYKALYIPANSCFRGHILKPFTNKRALKKDYSLWVTLLIMSSTWGHFVFLLTAPKQLHAALVVSTTTSSTTQCGPSKLILQMWKLLIAKEVPLCGSYWCICRRCWASFSSFPVYSKPTESFVTYFPEKVKIPICFTAAEGSPGETFRSCKTI